MTRSKHRLILILFFCATLLLCFTTSAAQLSHATARQIQQAYELQNNNQYTQAIALLNKINTNIKYDQAYINRMLGWLYWQKQQTNLAIKALTKAVGANALVDDEGVSTQRMLADLLLTEGYYQRAESRYLTLIKEVNDTKSLSQLWLRVAQAQYQQQKWPKVELAIGSLFKYQKKPQVTPLTMLLTAQLAQKKWRSSIVTTRKIRDLEPNNILWWQQLSNLYLYINDKKNALITLQQADRARLVLTKQQRELMANLYADAQVPFNAAYLYNQLDDLATTETKLHRQAIYWQSAKEWDKAIASWTKAAKFNNKYYWYIARLNLQLNRYQSVLAALQHLPKKTNQMLMVKVQALNELGNTALALTTAQQAHAQNPTDRSLNWIKYLTNK